jgi:hypothetical protein
MTAVVGILNKQAVALAADSAVTISGSNSRKIFNGANKLFTLSKVHPVGVMLYNSASFMSTPWETIIKVYRKQLGKKSFKTVQAYQEDFIQFLHTKDFFADEETKKLYLKDYFIRLIDFIIKISVKSHKQLVLNPTDANKIEILKLVDSTLDKLLEDAKTAELCSELKELTFENFNDYASSIVNEAIDHLFTKNGFTLETGLIDKIKKTLHEYVRSQNMTSFTGLIFTGFGDDEIYPSLIPVNISFAFQDKLKYFVDSTMSAKISNQSAGAICPFAQTDVIDTILSGIDPTLDKIYLENFEKFLTKYNQEILNILGTANPELTAKIQGLDIQKVVEEYTQKNAETKQSNYINPLMNAVSTLSKPDLAEMAESLIYLTYLKRRITFAEESVGGPVDVAIISKGDGFIWVKRKHYFKPELNQQFFGNYFN